MTVPQVEIYKSDWTGLSPHLVGYISQVKKRDGGWFPDPNHYVSVHAAISEASMEVVTGWTSPFEGDNSGSLPTTQALLQAGYPQQMVDALGLSGTSIGNEVKNLASKFAGRSSATKLNSTQVFDSMQPAKISATLILRAWSDPVEEVEKPLDQLMRWALPQHLATGGVLSRYSDDTSLVDALMPSISPHIIALTYKNRYYAPMVIESISVPLDSPVDARGHFVSLQIPITLSTLSAIDSADWDGYLEGQDVPQTEPLTICA